MNSERITGNSKVREDHRVEILNYIRKNAPISRTAIFADTNISKATVTRVIEDLLSKELIIETGQANASIGRKPVQIELNPVSRYVVGVNISRRKIYLSVADITMKVILSKQGLLKGADSVDSFIQIIAGMVNDVINESGIDRSKIEGVGVGVPGIVDNKNGYVYDFAITHEILNIPLKQRLEDILSLRVVVDNNANTRALGELWYGYGAGFSDLIFIHCSEGVGAGIISQGNILRGKNNITGEIGHMVIDMEGEECSCGRKGCVEAYCSTEGLEELAHKELKANAESSGLSSMNIDEIDYKAICRGYEKEDARCRRLINNAAVVLGTGISNLVNILNPEIIILSGDMFDECGDFSELVMKQAFRGIFNGLSSNIIFKKRKAKDALFEIGAATLVLKEFFKE